MCLYSKYITFYITITNKFSNFFRSMFYTKTIKKITSLALTNKETQCVPVFSYSSKFITYAPFLILFGKLFLEYTPLNLGSFL